MLRGLQLRSFFFPPSSRAPSPLALESKDSSSPRPPSCHALTFRYTKKADLFLSPLPSIFFPLHTGPKLVRQSRPVSPVLHPTRPSTTATILSTLRCTHSHIYRQRLTFSPDRHLRQRCTDSISRTRPSSYESRWSPFFTRRIRERVGRAAESFGIF